MKKLIMTCLLFSLFIISITPVYASVEIQATIDQDVHVVFDLKNINSTIYEEIQNEQKFNASTIPEIIVNNLKQQNLTNVNSDYNPLEFDNSANSIRVTFNLFGSDILNFTISKTTMKKVYNVRTDWRKFHVSLTDEFSLNFAEYLGTPVAQWRQINYTDPEEKTHPAYVHNPTNQSFSDPLFYFILPTEATNVHAIEDTIIFELPLTPEESIIGSPILILGAVIIVIIASSLYRKMRI